MRRVTAALLTVAAGLGLSHEAGAAEPIVTYRITNAEEIPESLTGAPGDPARGAELYEDEPRAGCAACHGMPGAATGDDDPKLEAAPDLSAIGGRLSPGAIRLWIVAPQVLDPETAMPAYYAPGQRLGADDPLYGGPALTAAEIEDLVAYLAGLGGPD
ncbi:MAG: c-type cytochrome [Paracoccaceae bacterium]|nr:c-type cytochrome [Paracoccaceae bacterium]